MCLFSGNPPTVIKCKEGTVHTLEERHSKLSVGKNGTTHLAPVDTSKTFRLELSLNDLLLEGVILDLYI